MSEAAVTLYKARAMIALSRKYKDTANEAWWSERAQSIACAILSTHAR